MTVLGWVIVAIPTLVLIGYVAREIRLTLRHRRALAVVEADTRAELHRIVQQIRSNTMSQKCTIHGRENCVNGICRDRARKASSSSSSSAASSSPDDNTGQVGIDNQGDLTIGIGGGLGIDTSDGSLTFGGGGFSVDTDGE